MSKNLFKLFVVLSALFLFLNSVNAASKCSYSEQLELNNAVANIKVSYEEAEESTGEFVLQEDGIEKEIFESYFKISIYNMTEDVYVKITNDYNKEIKTITYSQTESGVGIYKWSNIDAVTNFKITVYSSNKTNCPNEEYRIINFITPRYNYYSNTAKCVGNEDFYLCQKYITETKEIDFETFEAKLKAYLKNNELEQSNDNNLVDNLTKDNKLPIIIVSTIIVIAGVVAIVIVIKKRRSRVI